MRVSVADYHVGSHTHALHVLLSGVARSGKTQVSLVLKIILIVPNSQIVPILFVNT